MSQQEHMISIYKQIYISNCIIWDTVAGKALHELTGHTNFLRDLSFNP